MPDTLMVRAVLTDPSAFAATASRSLYAVARRLDQARRWDHVVAALRVNRRVWARIYSAKGLFSSLSPDIVSEGMALAASAIDGKRWDDYHIEAIIGFNRRMAAILAPKDDLPKSPAQSVKGPLGAPNATLREDRPSTCC